MKSDGAASADCKDVGANDTAVKLTDDRPPALIPCPGGDTERLGATE